MYKRSITGLFAALALLFATALPAAAQNVPRPAEVIGFELGSDYKLANHSQLLEYYRVLDAASERVKVKKIGESVMGRPMILAFISSAENIDRLERWKRISEQLARARISEEKARRLAERGKAIVWIDAGMHSTEVATAQHTPLLAYRVATEESAEMRRIRQNVVLLLMPNMNPDGLHRVDGWYERWLGTPYETSELPILYHHFVGHDNNRDWYTIFMPETKAVAQVLYHEWYPQIVYNHHQSAPFPARIWVPPFSDPVNPAIPAGVVSGVNQVGAAMAKRFAEKGMPGVVSRIGFDMWWNGGMRNAPYYHNMIGILTETAANEYANPHYYPPDSLPDTFGGQAHMSAERPSVFYPDPWEGGWWRLEDQVAYMITASMAVLDYAAGHSYDLLYNIYQMGRRSIDRGRQGDPFAFVLPMEQPQWDPGAAVALVNILRRGGIEIERATDAFRAGGERYPAGSYIIYTAQAFRPYIMDLMTPHDYPKRRLWPGGPLDRPYDISGWTLPIQMNVVVAKIEEEFQAETVPVDRAPPAEGRLVGEGDWGWLLSHRPTASAEAVNRLLAAGAQVSWAMEPVQMSGRSFGPGAIVIRGADRARIERLADELGLDFFGLGERPDAPLEALEPARIGLYKSWEATADEGWTRWLLKNYAFAVDTLHDARIRSGELARYDAIILPDQGADDILHGHASGTMPPKYTGGLGLEGALALKRYVEQGGTLVALDDASHFVIQQFGLPVRSALRWVPESEFSIPGSLVRLQVDTDDPLGYGLPERTAAFFVNSNAFEIIEPASEGGERAPRPPVEVIARYGGEPEELLLSGWALGERYVAGEPAMVRVAVGEGDVVLIGFRSQFRGQPRGTFKLLFNALRAATLEEMPEADADREERVTER